MMKSIIVATAFLSLAAPVFAAKAPEKSVQFVHKGVDYAYKVADNADGTRTIKGTANDGRDVYLLHVKGERVSGTVNGQRVSFSTKSLVNVTETTVQIASD